MIFRRCKFFLFVLVIALFATGQAAAEEINKTFEHSLGFGNSAKSFEHKIDLSEELAAEGKYFIARSLKLDGKLVIEREELTKTYYYIKVRLPKATLWFAKGNVQITLKAEKTDAPAITPNAPDNLKVWGGNYARFSWNGSENLTAISLYDKSDQKTIWERVILDKHECVMDEGYLDVGHSYVWAVKQAGLSGKYSSESQNAFKVGTKQERCRHCFGSGYVTCKRCNGSGHVVVNGPDDTPVSQICYNCHGTGKEKCMQCLGDGYNIVPVIIPENKTTATDAEKVERTLLKGRISSIVFEDESLGKNDQGLITISDKNQTDFTFKVSKYTLILVSDKGSMYAGELKQLKPGWRCELAYDIPDDDYYSTSNSEELKYADNMIVYYPGNPN
ncbi:MAG: hypothetical protein ACQETH_12885 [Candidatus Rifleibacteriota bacterium]